MIVFIIIVENQQLLRKEQIIVIYPSFTEAAYNPNGFYYYYNKACGVQCLTVHFNDSDSRQMSSSRNAFKIFKQEGFKLIDDSKLDSNPDILKNYSKVIVLHNEYVTQTEFNAITSHSNVLYLYPNSLYGKVQNNHNGTITLLEGHGYKTKGNAFGWKDDNTRYELDRDCKNLKFYDVTNGRQINCYPEYSMDNSTIALEIMHR